MHVHEKMYRCAQNDFLTATNYCVCRTLNLIVLRIKYLRNIIITFKIKDILANINQICTYYKS